MWKITTPIILIKIICEYLKKIIHNFSRLPKRRLLPHLQKYPMRNLQRKKKI